MDKTRLYVVRHGETDWNAQERLQGSIERPLNDKGREQARQVGHHFAKIPFKKIYSSPMERAKETAEIINFNQGCEIGFESDLREGSFGVAEGLKRQEYYLKFAKELELHQQLPRELRLKNAIAPLAESLAQVAERAIPVLQKIANNHPGEDILVVSHGWVIRSLIIYLSDHDDQNLVVPNLGFALFEGNKDLLTLKHSVRAITS